MKCIFFYFNTDDQISSKTYTSESNALLSQYALHSILTEVKKIYTVELFIIHDGASRWRNTSK